MNVMKIFKESPEYEAFNAARPRHHRNQDDPIAPNATSLDGKKSRDSMHGNPSQKGPDPDIRMHPTIPQDPLKHATLALQKLS